MEVVVREECLVVIAREGECEGYSQGGNVWRL